ncbi:MULTISPECIES: snapalysin family zinc-dependent metalloprotease [Nocardiopsis]|uniref:Extracellular small neutral protease n=1 Tax=Nocardiopsis sinuspersici TaxID=501010 RepID=A0A1V3C3K1_9ACTN|nr:MULTISPECIES: snapalysin family zinc-dependent metalloprotease [Nocardiopsis]NYH51445.1 snapalysin [Nocardiopsis sinuspersici]OOC55086.1 metalloprotease [Nocardiopsis sinuspersici]
MLRRILTPLLIALSALTLTLVGAAPATAAPAEQSQSLRQTVLYYDASRAAEYTSAVSTAVRVWNSSVSNVRLEPASAGRRAEIRVVADNGWPRAHLGPVRPGGQVTVWMGREGTVAGYDAVRIAAHELGHSLGLPDAKPGPCSSLMSGSTGGVNCTNPYPNSSERSRVEANYGSGLTGQRATDGQLLVDRF